MSSWTIGRRIAVGFGLMAACCLILGGVALYSVRTSLGSLQRLVAQTRLLGDANLILGRSAKQSADLRGFLITGEDRYVESYNSVSAELDSLTGGFGQTKLVSPELIDQLQSALHEKDAAVAKAVALRRAHAGNEAIEQAMGIDVTPKTQAAEEVARTLVGSAEGQMDDERRSAERTGTLVLALTLFATLLAAAAATVVAVVLTRSVTGQIGSAVVNMQNSSTELQAAANQQATGSKEQSSSMTEVSTTIKELLASSQQIAQSAQQVSRIAGETGHAALLGDQTLDKTRNLVGGIKGHVDTIVAHMLDLGKKSQQVGGILEVINELAEQTNILAINATIEAAGAGEAGNRFAVVADEIRKLADRVTGSAKEIRSLIEEMRSAVNATVMATEVGSKAVDAGILQFSEVATTFKRIVSLVDTTGQAAKEIELSTRQQAGGVEQVNVAVANVAQAAREHEATANQTLVTAGQLGSLSQDLARMITQAAAH